MKNFTILSLTLLFIQATAWSQSCLPEGILFTTQAQIDNFQANYPNCTTIEGDVKINGEDITNLNSLIVLTSIEGSLTIGELYYPEVNPYLPNLTGLDNLTSIGGNLEIAHNDMLTNLEGLDSLTFIGGSLLIMNNDTLQSLNGLEGLTNIDTSLLIYINNNLINLSGLDNLTTIGSDFIVDLNTRLMDFSGVENLTAIGGDFYIGGLHTTMWIGNPSLSSLTGMGNLSSVAGDFRIAGNDSLSTLTGLGNLAYVRKHIEIFHNNTLTSLTGLENIEAGSINDLYIYENPFLTTCHVQSICNYLASPIGTIEIHNNAPGCNSREEVVEACTFGITEKVPEERCVVYPNPTNGIVNFQFGIVDFQRVTLKIYDLQGREVATLLDEQKPAGEHTVSFDTRKLPSGIYIYRISNTEYRMSNFGKLVVVK